MVVSLVWILISYIPVQLAIALYLAPAPQAILTLGGRTNREEFTAEFAKTHPNLDIWVSSGMEASKAKVFFAAAGIPESRVNFDYRAVDTVTNFTTLVNDFKQRHIRHLYLITSDYHMPRAKAIATIVLGSRGIAFTPVTVPSYQIPETGWRIGRDVLRSLCWLVTNRTGASLRSWFPSDRVT